MIEFLSSSVHKRDIILPEEILKDFVEIQRLVIDTFKAQKMKENKEDGVIFRLTQIQWRQGVPQ